MMTKSKDRPKLNQDGPSIQVTIRLPAKQFDAYCTRARRADVSVPEIIRRDLQDRREFFPASRK